MASRQVGIIGSGAVAQALGAGFLKHGWRVMLGTRDPGKLREWLGGSGRGAQAGSVEEAAGFGDPAVLAVKGTAAEEALRAVATLLNESVVTERPAVARDA